MTKANRNPQASQFFGALKDIAVDIAKAMLGEIRRAFTFGISGILLGGLVGIVGGLMYGFPILTSLGVGAVGGLVVALLILALVTFTL